MKLQLLSCIPMAIAGAALTATGSDPVTVAAIAGPLLSGVAGNILSSAFGAGEEKLMKAVFHRHPGIDENHHILLALRQAHLKALAHVLSDFDSARKTDPDEKRRQESARFSAELHAFLKDAGKGVSVTSGPVSAYERQVFETLPATFEKALAARGAQAPETALKEAEHVRADIEQAVLNEICVATATDFGLVPAMFANRFRERNHGWFDLFVRDAAARLKENEAFKTIWTAEQIVGLKHLVEGIESGLKRLEAGQARIESKVDVLPEATADALMRRLLEAGVLSLAGSAGVKEEQVIALAKTVAGHVEDFDQAMKQLQRMVEIAKEVEAEVRNAGNLDAFVRDVLERIASLSGDSRHDEAGQLAEDAFARWERDEAKRREQALANGIKFLEAGIRQDQLRLDAASLSQKLVKRLELTNPPLRFEAVRTLQYEWFERGRDKGLNFDLEVSIALARICLYIATGPDERGNAWKNLGNAACALGGREKVPTNLDLAVNALQIAMDEFEKAGAWLQRAVAQSDLGWTFWNLAERGVGNEVLETSISTLRSALEVLNQGNAPLAWANTQNTLGIALFRLGGRLKSVEMLEDAAARLEAALLVRTEQEMPQQWGRTLNNLANVFSQLGQMRQDVTLLQKAVAAYNASLRQTKRDRVPLEWAMTNYNLGIVHRQIGLCTNSAEDFELSVRYYHEALKERKQEISPLEWSEVQHNLGVVWQDLAKQTGKKEMYDTAIDSYRLSLQEVDSKHHPVLWEMSATALVSLLTQRGTEETRIDFLQEAADLYRQLINDGSSIGNALVRAERRTQLGSILYLLAAFESNISLLQEAEHSFSLALDELSLDNAPGLWAVASGFRAFARAILAAEEPDAAIYAEEARKALETAIPVLHQAGNLQAVQGFEELLLQLESADEDDET